MIDGVAGTRAQEPLEAAGARAVAEADRLRRAGKGGAQLRKLGQVARQLESFFLTMLMSAMRKTVKKSDFMSGGRGEEIFTQLFDIQVADRSTDRGLGFGIAKIIVDRYGKFVGTDGGPKGNRLDVSAGRASRGIESEAKELQGKASGE